MGWQTTKNNIRRWGVFSVVLNLTERQLAALIERGRSWPWNGYELRLMKEAGKYETFTKLFGSIQIHAGINDSVVRLYRRSSRKGPYAGENP